MGFMLLILLGTTRKILPPPLGSKNTFLFSPESQGRIHKLRKWGPCKFLLEQIFVFQKADCSYQVKDPSRLTMGDTLSWLHINSIPHRLPPEIDHTPGSLQAKLLWVVFHPLYGKPLLLIISFLCMRPRLAFSPTQEKFRPLGTIWITVIWPIQFIYFNRLFFNFSTLWYNADWVCVPVVLRRPWQRPTVYVTPYMEFLKVSGQT